VLFNSLEYIILFLPITIFVYFALNKAKLIQLAKGWLVFASLFFYAFWNIKYLPLILGSMIFNYSIGTTLNNPDNIKLKINRKMVLTLGIVCNLLLLGYYKYFNFFIDNINHLFNADISFFKVILPLGISFSHLRR
jgi:alginate O-acetyltransferase complex protein AlgI